MDFVFYITATVINKNAYLRHLICTYYLTRLKITALFALISVPKYKCG